MVIPQTPSDESLRLRALRGYRLLDTPPEPEFDDLAVLASQICGTPMALLTLVDEHRQWFKAKVGVAPNETPREISFCAHAIHGGPTFLIPDAAADDRFADNPFVTDEPRIRFYAAAPLVTPEGFRLGTLCVLDQTPRVLSELQLDALKALSRLAMSQFERRRLAASNWTQDDYKAALDFAARAHGVQAVPGSGFPYVVHLAKVAMETMAACKADPALDGRLAVTCALLHDTLEDTDITESELAARFGHTVASGVRALTKDPAVQKEARMADLLRRIREQPREIWIVKLADRITNLEPPPPAWPGAKRSAYLEEAREILSQLRGAGALIETRFEEKLSAWRSHCPP